MPLFKISTSPVRPDDSFGLVPLVPGKVTTVLQYRAATDQHTPVIAEYGVTVIGAEPGAVLVELIDAADGATVAPLSAADVILVDDHATTYGLPNGMFDFDNDESRGVGYGATDEGVVDDPRTMDQAVAQVNVPVVRTFPAVQIGSRVQKYGPKVGKGKTVRLRVKSLTPTDKPLFVHAHMTLDN
jgi:hypothetical protein